MSDKLDDKLRLAEQSRQYYKEHKEQLNERRRELYAKNREEISIRRKKEREASPERFKAYAQTNRLRNSENQKKAIKSWQQSNKGRRVQLATSAKMRILYPEKYKARYMLRNAVRLDKVKKSDCYCSSTKVEAHHYLGYAPEHWYDVQWLCRKHHTEAHNA